MTSDMGAHHHSSASKHHKHRDKSPAANGTRQHHALSHHDPSTAQVPSNDFLYKALQKQQEMNGKHKTANGKQSTNHSHTADDKISLSPLQLQDTSESAEEAKNAENAENKHPIKVIAFDLDKTLVRTISLHIPDQPQPEQYPGSYFMFFDEDTKEYHHVYQRPYLKELLAWMHRAIPQDPQHPNYIKMMMCTHGTEKYAKTILERIGAGKLFPLMLPRKDWTRRKFQDDYKPRRYKTIEKMSSRVHERVEDTIMIDDDPGVYNAADRSHGSLLHIVPFDDPYEQREDCELKKLQHYMQMMLKHGKSYHLNILKNAIGYTGLVPGGATNQKVQGQMHGVFRVELLKRLVRDFELVELVMDTPNADPRELRLATLFLFDRYCAGAGRQMDWETLSGSRLAFAHYVLVMFGCLFLVRQYLWPDNLRPKQFRRDPYSAEVWLAHIKVYERMVRKYKTLDGRSVYDA